jgi:hypothetical protein
VILSMFRSNSFGSVSSTTDGSMVRQVRPNLAKEEGA